MSISLRIKNEIMEHIASATNEALLAEFVALAGGDDWDGAFTERGSWEFKRLQEELYSRLTKCGYLPCKT